MKNLALISVIFAIFLVGCTPKTQYISGGIKSGENDIMTMGIDAADFDAAAIDATESLLKSGVFDKKGKNKNILAIGRITNDTTQRIDTDLLTKKIRIELLNSGKVLVTTALSEGMAEDRMTYQTRNLRENEEFKQDTVAKKGTLYAPDYSLSGKIIQRSANLDRSKRVVDYYFQLTLTDVETGLALWENENKISKVGSNKTVTW